MSHTLCGPTNSFKPAGKAQIFYILVGDLVGVKRVSRPRWR